MDLPEAAQRFKEATSYCDDVVTVHRRSGGSGRGFRDAETSLNRAVIVMAVAAWQVAVENMVLTAVDQASMFASSNPPLTALSYVNLVKGQVARFSTPNSMKSRELLLSVGYDPQPVWNGYTVRGRPAAGTFTEQLDGWLRVRHAIAHADSQLPLQFVLAHVRESHSHQISKGVAPAAVVLPATPGLRLQDAESCLGFVRRAATLTGNGFSTCFNLPAVSWT